MEALQKQGIQVAYARAPRAPDEIPVAPEPDPTNLYLSNLPREVDEHLVAPQVVF
jgi:hypothetical protein